LMKKELEDPIFGVEISRQPGLLHQILAAAAQNDQANAAAAAGGTGAGADASNPELAMMNSNGESGETMPMTAPQQRGASMTSPEGAVAATTQRKTGVTVGKSNKK